MIFPPQNVPSLSLVLEVEERCVQVLTNLVVNLSEAQFRQMFLKMFDWAAAPSAPKLRLITFYHMADRYGGGGGGHG